MCVGVDVSAYPASTEFCCSLDNRNCVLALGAGMATRSGANAMLAALPVALDQSGDGCLDARDAFCHLNAVVRSQIEVASGGELDDDGPLCAGRRAHPRAVDASHCCLTTRPMRDWPLLIQFAVQMLDSSVVRAEVWRVFRARRSFS